MIGRSNRAVVVAALLCALLASGLARPAEAQPKPEGEIRWALYVTLTQLWFDSAEVVGQLTPFWVHLAEWHRSPGRRAGADADQSVSVVGAARRGSSEEELTS